MFKDREEAGKKLAKELKKYAIGAVVYAIPRGGVVMGAEVARKLGLPLGLVIVRKVGHPGNPEYAVCVVSESGGRICNEAEVASLDQEWLEAEILKQRQEAKRRRKKYLSDETQPKVKGKTVILIDDGVATGLTFIAAIRELRNKGAKKIVAALPVVSREVLESIKSEVDEVVALLVPRIYLGSVGAYYEEFSQVDDEEVIDVLQSLD